MAIELFPVIGEHTMKTEIQTFELWGKCYLGEHGVGREMWFPRRYSTTVGFSDNFGVQMTESDKF